ncbi:MAG: AAA family ATPase [Planctomycetaceae bacterium]|nr:AAA family ATPase [Planctomycetaceae bacterium]MBV8606732.1 AAA family ATPase [Singulisphaera sp.]MBV8233351.1 AAA family ATPase [Planctomycetaceae bacterium]MBV8315621.1 AAA family ATPase [Planctomycetaceae bacterium]MBV8383999.1 AAA family ATPase [Planctomycetaceae bacterium]
MMPKGDATIDFDAIRATLGPFRAVVERELGITLGKGGRCRCPFHDNADNPTSFHVNGDRAKCFGCGWKGDVFDFYARRHPECGGPAGAARALAGLPAPGANGKPGAAGKPGGTPGGKVYKTLEAALRAAEGFAWGGGKLGKPAHLYPYPAANGRVAAYIARYERRIEVDGEPGREKTFRPFSLHAAGWMMKDPPGKWPLYRLPEVLEFPHGTRVYVVEGEKCADEYWRLGLPATTSAHGAKSPHLTDWSPLAAYEPVLQPDRGRAGEDYGEAAADLLGALPRPPVVRVLRLPGLEDDGDDIVQWLELHDTWETERLRAEIERLAMAAPIAGDQVTVGASGRKYCCKLVIRGEDITPRAVEWLMKDRIPYGFLTIIAGMTGVGKSFLAHDIAARVTRGGEIPGGAGECFPKASVLIISEDDEEIIISPRMIAAGAEQGGWSVMTWEAMAEFTLDDAQMLGDTYEAAGRPRLIIIDPPTNFLGGKDEHRNAEVRSVLMKVASWAKSHKVAVILITHCAKDNAKEVAAVNKVIGSIAWGSTSRVVHMVAPDPDDPNRCVFVPAKVNIGPRAKGIAFRIAYEEEKRQDARIEWLGDVERDADEVMNGRGKDAGRPDQDVRAAALWLAQRLADGPAGSILVAMQGNLATGKPWPGEAGEKADRARLAVVKWWRMKVLGDRLGGKSRKLGMNGPWFFTLPDHDWPPPPQAIAAARDAEESGPEGETSVT